MTKILLVQNQRRPPPPSEPLNPATGEFTR